ATVRGVQQALDEKTTGIVALDRVVLHVEGFFSKRRHLDASAKAGDAARDQPEPGKVRMLANARLEALAELGLVRVGERNRLGPRRGAAGRERRARGQCARDRQPNAQPRPRSRMLRDVPVWEGAELQHGFLEVAGAATFAFGLASAGAAHRI